MPRYCYKCRDCEASFEVWHSMSFEGQKCTECQSESVYRVPSIQVPVKQHVLTRLKPGSIVEKYIEDTKSEIEQEKKSLKQKEKEI